MKSDRQTTPELIPVAKWNEYHDWPTTSALRHLIWAANSNGFDKAIRRVGRRVLIDEPSFYEWVEEQNSLSLSKKSLSS